MSGILDDVLSDQNRYRYDGFTLKKKIVVANANKLYKGHRGNVVLTSNSTLGTILSVVNIWWTIQVVQQIHVNINQSTVIIRMYYPSIPKYMTEFFLLLKSRHPNISKIKFSKNDHYFLEGAISSSLVPTPMQIFSIEFIQDLNEYMLFTPSETLDLSKNFNNRFKKLKRSIKDNMDNDCFIEDAFTVVDDTIFISHHLF